MVVFFDSLLFKLFFSGKCNEVISPLSPFKPGTGSSPPPYTGEGSLAITKFIKLVLFCTLLFPSLSLAATFTASLNKDHVAKVEGVMLSLELQGASAKSEPDISALNKDFKVLGRGQSSNVSIINGSMTSSTAWNYTLSPKKTGNFNISGLSVETDEGVLQANNVSLLVDNSGELPSKVQNQAGGNFLIMASVNKKNPYVGEAVIYTVDVLNSSEMINPKLSDIEVENVVIEQLGDPQYKQKVINGEVVNVSEIKYSITPSKAGKIVIPSAVVRGKVASMSQRRGNSIFDDLFDPLNITGGFGFSYKPFAIASEEVNIDVRKPPVTMDPWLPLSSLKISEIWDKKQVAKAGEPLARTITLVADGIGGNQLPSLEKKQNSDDFKVYSDKPEVEENIKNDKITGWRSESFTLIPKESGELVLPEIKIPWWNVEKDRIEYATLPARKLNVAESDGATSNAPAGVDDNTEQPKQVKQPEKAAKIADVAIGQKSADLGQPAGENRVLYWIIGVLSFLLFAAIIWGIRWKNKAEDFVGGQNDIPDAKAEIVKSKMKIGDIKKVKDLDSLKDFIIRFANSNYGVPNNASMQTIAYALIKLNSNLPKEKIEIFFNDIDAALYSGKDINLDKAKNAFIKIVKGVDSKRGLVEEKKEVLSKLNPS